jgi:glycosyltransferase involved in cell wall biosynthesis
LTDLRIGGGELLPLILLPRLRGFEGVVALFKDSIQHRVPTDVRVVALGPAGDRLRTRIISLLPSALRLSRDADLLIGGLEGAPIILAAVCGLLTRRPVVGVVPTHLERHIAAVRMSAIERRLLLWALRSCRAVITASEDGRDSLVSSGVRADRVHVIPNPVSPWAVASQREPRSEGSAPRLLTVGRLERVKGMDLALEAAAQLGDVAFTWEIVGDGSQAAALRARNAALGLESKVRLSGLVDELAPHYRDADCFVLASRVEGLPIAILEAMANGLAIVATRSGRGVEEALGGGKFGVLVASEDPAALAAAIRGLLVDPLRLRDLGEAARRRARDFSPERIAYAYSGVFRTALERGRAAAAHARS